MSSYKYAILLKLPEESYAKLSKNGRLYLGKTMKKIQSKPLTWKLQTNCRSELSDIEAKIQKLIRLSNVEDHTLLIKKSPDDCVCISRDAFRSTHNK